MWGLNLHVIKLPKNTGTPGLPRNVGIQFARGKYIAFLDSDDLFTKTALEELSTLAEEYQADVVHLYSNYILWSGKALATDDPAFTDMNELINPKNFTLQSNRKEKSVAPNLESENLIERVHHWLMLPPEWSTCLSFCRRDFLIANQILFSDMETCEDAPFSFKMLCLAKNYLIAPNVIYIIRPRLNSAWRYKGVLPSEKSFHKDMVSFKGGFREFARIMDGIKFFGEHPDYRYAVLNWFANTRFEMFMSYYANNSPVVLTSFVEREFSFDDKAFAAHLFDTANIYRLQIMRLQQELAKFQKQ